MCVYQVGQPLLSTTRIQTVIKKGGGSISDFELNITISICYNVYSYASHVHVDIMVGSLFSNQCVVSFCLRLYLRENKDDY